MTTHRVVVTGGILFGLLVALATAPLWSPAIGLGPSALPAGGAAVMIASGYRINVVDEGAGPAVMLIHGLPGSAHDWDPLPKQLVAAGFRVVRYDRVGYGHSDRRANDGEHRLEVNAAELMGLVSALRLESPILVGWSYGGGVALRAAADDPGRVAALLLVGSMGPSTDMGGLPAVGRVVEPLRRWGIASGFPARLGIRLFGRTFFSGAFPESWTDHALAVVASPGALHTWTVEAVHTDPGAIRPERVRVPVTIVHGSLDRIAPLATADDLHRRLRTSELVTVAGGSHMLPNTHAALIVEKVRELDARRRSSTP